ncbi:T9SS type A sorting domain-containing protein [Crocinitomicaceae bacterium]|nr:T9SS type A sorting domain-containing protein [Crocinitomicaceae bacterium]
MKRLLLLFFIVLSNSIKSQVIIDTLDNPLSTPLQASWVVPQGIYQIEVLCWGGGGSGGGATGQAAAGGGGSGGGFASKIISVQPGDVFNYNIGVGGSQSYGNGNNGTDTWFINAQTVLAKGGLGGYGQSAHFGTASGAPQVLNGNIGDNTFYGGKGGTGTYGQNGSEAGGGGGAGGTTENGLNGAGRQGGQGGFNGGGDGAWAGSINCNCHGQAGENPGGGGSGGQAPGVADRIGGPGGAGRILISYTIPGIGGQVYLDLEENCINNNSIGISGVIVLLAPTGIVSQTDQNGFFRFNNIPADSYILTLDTTMLNWTPTCPLSQSYVYSESNLFVQGPNFGLINNNPCTDPDISIFAPSLRRCFSDRLIFVSACNQAIATGILDSSYVDVELDQLLTLDNASLPYTDLGNNIFRFETGNIYPGQCVNFTLSTTVSCDAQNGQTLCMNATLYPAEDCIFDSIPSEPVTNDGIGGTLDGLPEPCTLPWDKSSLQVDGWCQGDSVYFSVTNTGDFGDGDMECYSPVWLTVDGVVTDTDSLQIQGGETVIYSYPASGQTFFLNAEQHPLHPGNSHPNAHVELCGDSTNWTPGVVNQLPQDDADPDVDIYCGQVTAPVDPNDKTGYPLGQTEEYYIQPNQQLQYVIRFQNVGTDTAFTVVVRDTLDIDLNIFTVTPGVSSHPYTFKMYGPRVLEWTFEDIQLPDSTTNSEGSNGFLTFHVDQVSDLTPGTVINNDVDIYFDFELPITTNTTVHKIFEGFVDVLDPTVSIENYIAGEAIEIYPNPTTNLITIQSESVLNNKFKIFDQQGREVMNGKLTGKNTEVSLGKLSRGTYTIQVDGNYKPAVIIKQ